MAYCPICGEQVADSTPSCPKCGAPLNDQNGNRNTTQQTANEFINNLNNTADYSNQMDASDVENNKAMAVLAYIGILVFIPIFAAPNSKYARYHSSQGLTLFIFEMAYGIITTIIAKSIGEIKVVGPLMTAALSIIGLVWLVLSICGIVNAVNGKAKDLPVIGNIHIIK